uniref:Uncharacterized protein n=1 Tax=Arundo donax TaxID=35708 RepID=A0A0A9ELD9_ARUDO
MALSDAMSAVRCKFRPGKQEASAGNAVPGHPPSRSLFISTVRVGSARRVCRIVFRAGETGRLPFHQSQIRNSIHLEWDKIKHIHLEWSADYPIWGSLRSSSFGSLPSKWWTHVHYIGCVRPVWHGVRVRWLRLIDIAL